jgi:hypothetical protein
VSEPLLRPNPPEVSRHPALERGFSVLLVGDNPRHRIPREEEVLAIASKEED